MVPKGNPSDLYLRWLLIVYLPLGLLAVALILLPFGILPGWTKWLLVLLAAYAVPAVRLLVERRRSGLGIPLPHRLIVSIGVLCGMLAVGLGLFVAGMGSLTTSRGLAMVYIGGCFMILSVTVPTFRLLDIVLRKAGRAFRSLNAPSAQPRRNTSKSASPTGPRARPPAEKGNRRGRHEGTSRTRHGTGTAASARQANTRPSGPRSARAPQRGQTPLRRPRSPSPIARIVSGARQARRRVDAKAAQRSQRTQQPPLHRLAVPPSSPPES